MDFAELRQNWNTLGRIAPVRAIVSSCDEDDIETFFTSGRTEVAAALDDIRGLGIVPGGRALDFGCGMGRISQALAIHFRSVVGVDIAASMIALAESHNAARDKCTYLVNEVDDLSAFDDASFDFVFSTIVLQHVGTELAKRYIGEFVRVLAPEGIAYFQLPSSLKDCEPLTEQAQRATIDLIDRTSRDADFTTAVGQTLSFPIAVQNNSALPWQKHHRVGLVGLWVDGTSREVVNHEHGSVWVALDRELSPGERMERTITVQPPASAGLFILQIGLAQDRVSRFIERDAMQLEVRVEVTVPLAARSKSLRRARNLLSRIKHAPSTTRVRANDGGAPRTIEDSLVSLITMEGVERKAVVELLETRGADVIATFPDVNAGPEWESFRYVARRRRI